MGKRSRAVAVLFAMLLGLTRQGLSDWTQMGIGSLNFNTNSYVNYPALAISGNTPYIAFCEHRGLNYHVYVKYWNGAAWVQDAGQLDVNASATSQYTSIALHNGTPYVTWQENTSFNRIYVKHWNGVDWAQDGTGPLNLNLNYNTGSYATYPSMISAFGRLYLAWCEYNGSFSQLYVKYWNGSIWQQAYNPGYVNNGTLNVNFNAHAYFPSLASSAASLRISFHENSPNGKVYVKHWTGNSWAVDGTVLNANGNSNAAVSKIAENNGTPYVAWHESNGTVNQIYAKYWNGTSWASLGGSLNLDTGHQAYYPTIAMHGNTPYVAWREILGASGQIYVKHWNGSAWVQDGGSLNVNVNADGINPVIRVASNTAYVAWTELVGGTYPHLYVKKLDLPTPTPTATPVVIGTPTPQPTTVASKSLRLINNELNPNFHQQTTVRWSQPRTSATTITIYSLAGDKVATLVNAQTYAADQYHEVRWDGRDSAGNIVGSGIYIVHLKSEMFEDRGKIAVVK